MFDFLVGFGVCAACFVTGILSAGTVKDWLSAAWAKISTKA